MKLHQIVTVALPWHPPKVKRDWAFILHMLATAKRQSGRVVVVVPHGVLFRSLRGRTEKLVLRETYLTL